MADLTMYTTSWCGFCRRLKMQLDDAGIAYREIDIEREPDAASFVEKANGGNRTVPLVLYADETTATNPSFSEVKAKLAA
ncbi:mycoredoxin [Pseudonocardia endophytica]|uniref:Mycoredoxin n=1 Tax=Pseudonocardia endophytica TaxID=401976 RepID=A0A4R1HVU6_PSEEN|nr:mycoredoxin [Pseudonocardia endophytica]TCK26428.1 mycoredoxin [Pseudonocardia endophytica]